MIFFYYKKIFYVRNVPHGKYKFDFIWDYDIMNTLSDIYHHMVIFTTTAGFTLKYLKTQSSSQIKTKNKIKYARRSLSGTWLNSK